MPERRTILAGAHHPALEQFLNVKENRKGNPEKKITLEGLFEIRTALRLGVRLGEFFVAPELLLTPETKALFEELSVGSLPIFELSARWFRRLSDRDEPDGVAALAFLPIYSWPPQTAPRKLAVLDGLEIPGNVGTILRSADGAGFDAVVYINRKVRLTHPKMVHASQGACFTIPAYETDFETLGAYLKVGGYQLFLADAKGNDSRQARPDPARPLCLVIGGEKKSFHPGWFTLPHLALKIPMRGRVDSLNAACAATVLFYALTGDPA